MQKKIFNINKIPRTIIADPKLRWRTCFADSSD